MLLLLLLLGWILVERQLNGRCAFAAVFIRSFRRTRQTGQLTLIYVCTISLELSAHSAMPDDTASPLKKAEDRRPDFGPLAIGA